MAFRGRILKQSYPDEPHLQKHGRFGKTPVLRTRQWIEDAAERALESAACRRCGGGAGKALWQTNHRKGTHGEASPRRSEGERRR